MSRSDVALAGLRLEPTSLESRALGSRALQRLTDVAGGLLRVPCAQVSLLGECQTAAVVTGGRAGAQLPLSESLCALVVAGDGPLVVPDAARDPRVNQRSPVASGEIGAYAGVPLHAQGRPVGALCVYGPQPRDWSDGDLAVLRVVADSVAAELELASVTAEYEVSRLRWELAIDAAEIGSFDWEPATGRLTWDDRMLALFGYHRAEFPGTIAGFVDRLHPDDVDRVTAALRAAIDTVGGYDAEFRVLLPSGDLRWIRGRGRAVADTSGTASRLLGAAYDTTVQRDVDARVSRVLESMPAAFFSLGRDWTFTHANAEAERLLRRSRDELVGGSVWELFPAALGTAFEEQYRGAMASGRPTAFEAYYPPPLDSWFEVRAWPSPEGLSVYFLDVTERHRTEEAARRDAARLALIARVSDMLSAALIDRRAGCRVVQELAEVVVPTLGDWVIASLVQDDGRLRDVASWHRDPALRPVAADYARLRLAALTSTAPIVEALATGEASVVSDVAAAVGRTLPPGEVRDRYWQLDPGSAVALPLTARGRLLGAMSVYRDRGREPMDAASLGMLREVAERVAVALDSAALHEQERRMAAELQRSLLTEPPQPEDGEVVVRYVPAAQAAQVGGDWYDAFDQPDGSTVLAIGDVVGHDTVAAAAMGQLRSLLRGIAYTGSGRPAAVLTALDRTMAGLQVHTLATAAVAQLERGADGVRLRWSSAGHPPLLVRSPDGRVRQLAGERADLMLGVRPGTPRHDQVVVLAPGATVLLYTDGLVEGPDLPLDDGVARLTGLLAELGELPLGELCDQLVTRMRPRGSEDDVALVAVRLHPGPTTPDLAG